MPARSPREAVGSYLDRLRPITLCITERPVQASGYQISAIPDSISFVPLRQPVPVRSRHARRRILLDFNEEYLVDATGPEARDRFEVRIVGYRYRILEPDGRELVAYHWHPSGVSDVRHPHVHLSSRIPSFQIQTDSEPVALAEIHLPTGFVSLADIVRLLIVEFGVEPRRQNWEAILNEG